MNITNFLFEKSRWENKDFIAGIEEKISYKKLYATVEKTADSIHKNFGQKNKVLLISDNSLFFVINYLSILKSNNVVVLIDPRSSGKEIGDVANLCSCKIAFVQSAFQGILSKAGIANIFTEHTFLKLSEEQKNHIHKPSKKDCRNDVAVIIFTSGSTGSKKGVMLTHNNIKANTESIVEYLSLDKNDRMEVVLPFFYCYGLSLLHTHLRVGGSLVLNRSIFLGSVIREIKKYKCTGFSGVPSTFYILTQKTDFLDHNFPSLRYITQAGGRLEEAYIKKIATSFPDSLFFVMYGATEATSRLSFLPPHVIDKKSGSIGKGIPGVKLMVIDEHGKRVKPNNVGEIIAYGENIMKGYYKNPRATARVIKNGWYHTGDLAIADREGFIYIVGRKNTFIKSAGHKVFPYEIEKVINAVKYVSHSVVVGVADHKMGEAIVGLVETSKPSSVMEVKIFSICRKLLPSYKIPQKIFFTEKIPLTSSNKVDILSIKQLCISKFHDEH